MNIKFKSEVSAQLMEGRGNSGGPVKYVIADNFPTPVTHTIAGYPTISGYNGSEKDTHGINIPDANLNKSTLILS